MILHRIEHVLELEQPEEQPGCRPARRIEEHLLTANILLDKATAGGMTIWIVSLDLSKAFDRVHWPPLWAALRDQGVSEHCIWSLIGTHLWPANWGGHGRMGQEPEFFNYSRCKTRMCVEPKTRQRYIGVGFAWLERCSPKNRNWFEGWVAESHGITFGRWYPTLCKLWPGSCATVEEINCCSWALHHLRILIGRWSGTIFSTARIFGFKAWLLQLR